MTVSANLYATFLEHAMKGGVVLAGITPSTLKMALLTGTYTPDLSTDEYWGTVTPNEVTGTGYTAGGATLATPVLAVSGADTWAHNRAATTVYTYGQIVRPATANGHLYRCVTAGTTGTSLPTYPTVVGRTVTDGSAEWGCVGGAVLTYTSATVRWPTATFSASYAVLYVSTGTAATSPLIGLVAFGTAQAPTNQTFEVVPDATLGWFTFTPPS